MIINTENINAIYLATSKVDMRKSIDGLVSIVTMEFKSEVISNTLFIFTNKNRNRLKILYYENHGYWLFLRRLDRGTFKVKEDKISKLKTINSKQLEWLINGMEVEEKKIINHTKYESEKWLNM